MYMGKYIHERADAHRSLNHLTPIRQEAQVMELLDTMLGTYLGFSAKAIHALDC